ncbi:MAG: hypothetical protein O4803_10275, partial [Trichodesmium sp. St15_bin1_1]|nr:hypothetical protein [Trichodesmium sp. St18_bin1]MDE5089403.1 hypothetical protein [Trichodesmium sp. St16_bin2-tuft]MDE5114616.1 hypothetical protein [Trichodesmium sp. St15_bin1_1]
RTYAKNPVKTVNHCFLTHQYLGETGFAEFDFVSLDKYLGETGFGEFACVSPENIPTKVTK